jgi:predicted PurR-regulated permease PerM
VIQAAAGRTPRSEPGVPPLPVERGPEGAPTPWADRRFWDVVPFRDVVLTVGVVGAVVATAAVTYYLRAVLVPVLVALVLAYLFNPLIHGLASRRVPRGVSAGVLAALIVAVEVVVVFWLGPLLVKQTVSLMREAPKAVRQVSAQIERKYDVDIDTQPLTQPMEELTPGAGPKQIDVEAGMRALQWAAGGSDGFAGTIMGAIGIASYVAVTAVLFPIYVFLIAWHLPGLARLSLFVPRRRREETGRILGLMNDAVSGFFRGRFIVSLIMCGLFAVGWWLCGVPYALLLGVGTGLLNIVPWASAVGWPLAVALAYADAVAGPGSVDWLRVVLWPSVVYGLVQGLDGWVLTPWIQSRAVDLSAVTVLIVIFVGGAVGGVFGLLLAVPVTACVKILLREIFMPRVRDWAERY